MQVAGRRRVSRDGSRRPSAQCADARRRRLLRSPRPGEPIAEERSAPRSARSSTGCATGSRSRSPRSTTRTSGSGPRSAVAVVGSSETQVREVLASVERFVVAAPDVELHRRRDRVAGVSRDARRGKYPRTARVNEVMLEVLADELERMSDPRLELVTLTGVDVTPRPRVRQGVLLDARRDGGRRAASRSPTTPADALHAAASHLRGLVGRQMRIRQVPKLTFELDPGIVAGQRIEEILRDIHHEGEPQEQAGAERAMRDGDGRVTDDAIRESTSALDRARPARSRARRGSRSRATSAPTATRSARCSRCTTCCAPRASSRRVVPEPFVVAPHYRELPGLDLLTPPDLVDRRARGDGHVRLRVARPPRRSRADGQGRGRARSSIDHHVSNERYGTINVIDPDAAASGVLVRRLIARARPAADPRRRGLPVRRARVRHRPLPVRVDDAARCSSSPRSSRASTCRSPSSRARCSRSTGSRTCSCSPTCSSRAELVARQAASCGPR